MNSLDRVLGNERIKEYMRTALKLNRISHSYIIEGEKGSGKKLLADCFCRMLQCEDRESVSDCGHCGSCIQIDHGNHPDVIYVRHEKPNTISVKEIREQVVNTADIRPYKGPYKIYIIDEAEKMNDQAQNALLKTIEEPPPYAVLFLLVSNQTVLLETILSRCVHLSTGPVREEVIYKYLTDRKGYSEEEAGFAAAFAMGNTGKALESISSLEFGKMRDYAFSILRSIPGQDMEGIKEYAAGLKDFKNNISEILDLFLIWFRDLLVIKTTGDKEKTVFFGEYEHLREQCDIISLRSLDEVLHLLEKTKNRIRANVNYETLMLLFLADIRRQYRQQER